MKNKRKILILSSILAFVLALSIFCVIYVSDFYRYIPDQDANSYEIKYLEDDTIVFEAENATAAFIFYPGGKVEYKSYIPLMKNLSDNGITCLLVDMPFNLAVLDVNRAKGLQEKFPNINGEILINSVGTTIGSHTGPGTVALFFWGQKRED